MATVPTTQQLADQNLTTLEGTLAQTSPLHNKAFLRVLAVMLAMTDTGLYKMSLDLAKQNLALTASGEDLDRLGEAERVYRNLADSAILNISIPATDGAIVPFTASFIGEANGQRYTVTSAAIGVAGVAMLKIVADTAGVAGNLQAGDSLNIVSPFPGVGVVATVIGSEAVGSEDETDDEYRVRILFKMRSTKGGGNPSDYKEWAEAVGGVNRAFPYAGKPVDAEGDSYPGDRTVYIQADASIEADGIPTNALLTEVRAALNVDPITGKSRPALGLIDATLYVEPIVCRAADITITGLTCPDGTEAAVRTEIQRTLDTFLRTFLPFVDGVDLAQDRNDRLTTPALSTVLQNVLTSAGSSAAGVAFNIDGTTNSYQLSANETLKLGAVNYAVN